jgi:hypothetical protein
MSFIAKGIEEGNTGESEKMGHCDAVRRFFHRKKRARNVPDSERERQEEEEEAEIEELVALDII